MSRRLPIILALLVLLAACPAEAPPKDPAPAPDPSAPPESVEPPPVVPEEAPDPENPAPDPGPDQPKAPEKPDVDSAMAPEAKPAVSSADQLKALVEQLGDPDAGQRFKAAVDLGKTSNTDAIGPLATTLKEDKDYFVKRAAARSLGELGSDEAVPALIEALGDSEVFVTMTAKSALERISGKKFETQAEWDAWWKKREK